MKSRIIEPPQIEIIEDSLELPSGWFTQYQIKSNLSRKSLGEKLKQMNLESKIGRAKINGNIRVVRLYHKK